MSKNHHLTTRCGLRRQRSSLRGVAWMSLLGGALFLFAACPGPKRKSTPKGGGAPGGPGDENSGLGVPTVKKTLNKKTRTLQKAEAQPQPILGVMEKELQRTFAKLKAPGSPKPYFVAYTVDETQTVYMSATLGTLNGFKRSKGRRLTVDMRVGSRKFDNTHFLERSFGSYGGSVPLEDDDKAVRTYLWLASDRIYRRAVEELERVKAKAKTSSKEEDDSADFSSPVKLVYLSNPAQLNMDVDRWKKTLRSVSEVFRADPRLTGSSVVLRAWATTRFYVSSEGSRLQLPSVRYQVTVYASTQTKDGMTYKRHESAFAHDPGKLPSAEKLTAMAKKVAGDLEDLRKAPLAHPYEGPAIFQGKAAAVFFHEVFGHRMEGHRQKLRRFDQTFTKKLGQKVMPTFLSVYDNPLIYSINGEFLNGHYLVDDEAVKAQRVALVKDGVLKGFLMSRTPIKTHPQSNGHGRRSSGRTVVARQGNLVIDSDRVVKYSDLRKRSRRHE